MKMFTSQTNGTRSASTLLCLACMFAFNAAAAEFVDASGLTLRVTLARPVALPMEPVVLDVLLQNNGTRVFLRSRLEPLSRGLPVNVVNSAGERFECLPAMARISELVSIEMKPGDRFAVRAAFVAAGMGANRGPGPLLLNPGDYTLEVGCMVFDPNLDGGKQISLQVPPIKIRVETPDEQEAKALGLWRQAVTEAGYDLPGTATDSEASKTLREQYGDTIYGLYVRYFHAEIPDREVLREDIAAHYALAAEALEDFLPVALETKFPLADDLLVSLANNYSMLSKNKEAAEAVEELQRRFPESPVNFRLQELTNLPNALRPFGPRELPPEQRGE